MRVVLAGFNVEAEILDEARRRFGDAVTPEVISASYARISRDPRGIAAIRKEARNAVEKARRSNERIVFGLGHASVAEHAVLNFDITGVSRLAVEEVEHFRLASFTEKSQRYIRLDKDIVVPPEIRGSSRERTLRSLARELHRAYGEILRAIGASGAEGVAAKEDARYLMPLATATQLGMTVNARELEHMIRNLAGHPLLELRAFSKLVYTTTRQLIPSLVRYPEPAPHVLDMPEAKRLGKKGREEIIAATMRRMGPHDAVWREFETIQFTFELIVSASCFAQLKRHRMATLIAQPYDIALGVSIPKTFVEARSVAVLRRAAAQAERLYRAIGGAGEPAAAYALLNAHRRRVRLSMNLRELYHFSRLRSDRSAQWEIRALSDEMCRLAKDRVPCAARLLGGKDEFQGMEARRRRE
jgi:flavin-dependent thymidylate synthase